LRFVVYSDLHLNLWNYKATLKSGYNSRLLAQRSVLEDIRTYCVERNITDLICCGDIFHTRGKIDAEVLDGAYHSFSFIHDSGIYQTWVVGNHDQKTKSGSIHSLSFLQEFGQVVSDFSINWPGEFSFMPYTEDKAELEHFFAECQNANTKICFIHQGVSGVPVKTGVFLDEIFHQDMIPDNVKHVFAGHYHQHKRVSDKITIPGAPMQHTWGDSGNRCGWLDVTYEDDGEVEIKHIESNHPKFVMDPAEAGEMDFVRDLDLLMEEDGDIDLTSSNFEDLETLISEFSTQKNLDEHSRRIGRNLREGTYEAPVIEDK
jgi:DNA repair exonuclease SbcCD nuclease subunit